jgi:hypothetical protein
MSAADTWSAGRVVDQAAQGQGDHQQGEVPFTVIRTSSSRLGPSSGGIGWWRGRLSRTAR